jgi:uncharacterized membrane protein
MSDSSSDRVPTLSVATDRAIDGAAPEPAARLQQILERHRVDPDKVQVVLQEVKTEIIKAHVGPLPSVEDFAGYDSVCPGSAKEILDMAVRQQKHHHHMDRYTAASEFWLPVIGIVAAVAVVVAMFGAGVYLALNGHETLAIGVLSGTGIVTAVGAFIQRSKNEEPAKPAAPPSRKLSRRERRERAAQARRNIINR